jgi:catechol 2,3-dioxygenase-like lactoylglutathione lyase family enzyme
MSLIAFVPSTDLARAQAFYEGVLGLEVIEVTPFALVLRSDGVMIRVTQVRELEPRPFTVLGWSTDAIADDVARLTGRGIEFVRYEGMGQNELGIWTAPGGDQVAWFTDPDGNVLSFTQFNA